MASGLEGTKPVRLVICEEEVIAMEDKTYESPFAIIEEPKEEQEARQRNPITIYTECAWV